MRTARSILLATADMFEADARAWIQGSYDRSYVYVHPEDADPSAPETCYCAVGGIAHAAGLVYALDLGQDKRSAAWRAVVQLSGYLARQGMGDDYTDNPEGRVLYWNDQEGRTVAEVVAALRAAAAE